MSGSFGPSASIPGHSLPGPLGRALFFLSFLELGALMSLVGSPGRAHLMLRCLGLEASGSRPPGRGTANGATPSHQGSISQRRNRLWSVGL